MSPRAISWACLLFMAAGTLHAAGELGFSRSVTAGLVAHYSGKFGQRVGARLEDWKEFVRTAPQRARERGEPVESILRIVRPLDIGIFAQAVEDESLVPLLEQIGLSGYQGFAGGRPGRMAQQ